MEYWLGWVVFGNSYIGCSLVIFAVCTAYRYNGQVIGQGVMCERNFERRRVLNAQHLCSKVQVGLWGR